MNTVTVGFSTSSGWISRAIRWVTRSRASHAWVCLQLHGSPVIVHATVGGVRVDLRSKWEKGNTIVGEFQPVQDISDGVEHTLTLLGQKYDYLGLLGFLTVVFWKRWFGKKIKNVFASSTSLVCSEFLVHLAHSGGIPEWDVLDPERTTPQDLLAACETGASFKRV